MQTPTQNEAIEALFTEARRFRRRPRSPRRPTRSRGSTTRRSATISPGGSRGPTSSAWMKPPTKILEWDEPFAKLVLGRRAQRVGQRARPPRCGRQGGEGRVLLRRRARRPLDRHLRPAARRGLPLRERTARARHQERRPRRDLHADDRRAAGRDARLRADRRRALGDLRRLLARLDRRSRQRLGVRRDHHRRPGLAARQQGAAQGERRRSDRQRDAVAAARDRREARRRSGDDARTVATCGGTISSAISARYVRARAHERRGPALPALHVGDDGEAERDQAHHRRLPDRRDGDAQARLRREGRHATSTGAPPTSAGSPVTRTSCTVRSATARRASSTKGRRTSPTRTVCGRSSSATR